jgi:hypothetical protein
MAAASLSDEVQLAFSSFFPTSCQAAMKTLACRVAFQPCAEVELTAPDMSVTPVALPRFPCADVCFALNTECPLITGRFDPTDGTQVVAIPAFSLFSDSLPFDLGLGTCAYEADISPFQPGFQGLSDALAHTGDPLVSPYPLFVPPDGKMPWQDLLVEAKVLITTTITTPTIASLPP